MIHKEGLFAGTPSILRIRNVLASTQICPRTRPLSLRFGMMCQHILENKAEVLLPEKNEIVIRPADVSILAPASGLGFLLQEITYYLLSPCVPARLGDLECLSVRRSEADLSRHLRGGSFIAAPERLILSCYFIGAKASKILPLNSFQRLHNKVQIRRCRLKFS